MLPHIRKSSPSPYPLFPGLVKICIQLNLGPDQTSNSCPSVYKRTPHNRSRPGGPIQKYQDKTQIPPCKPPKTNTKNTKTSLSSLTHKKLFLPETILFLPRRFPRCVWVKRPDNFIKSTWTDACECSCGTCRHGTAECRCDERSIMLYQIWSTILRPFVLNIAKGTTDTRVEFYLPK